MEPRARSLTPQQPKLKQCDGKRRRPIAGRSENCSHKGRYAIDGKAYCETHAALVALSILLGETP